MTTEERLDRIEAMLRFIIRELTYIPETDSMPEKPNLVRVKQWLSYVGIVKLQKLSRTKVFVLLSAERKVKSNG